MDPNYRVIGIIQALINGVSNETSVNIPVYAVDRSHAVTAALARYETVAIQQDTFAIARWHTPLLVRIFFI